MHRHMLHNDSVVDASSRAVSPGQVGVLNGWGVFSTIRVADGVLFAFERHFRRMARDAKLMKVPFYTDPDVLEEKLIKLVEANEAFNATLRVAVIRNRGGIWEGPGVERDFDTVAFTTGLTQWGDSVTLGVVPHARHAASEFAGTKILSWSQNLTWYDRAHERGWDEVVLLNERGEVSECTSANIFVCAGSCVFTPPLLSGCLPGITRELLLQEIHVPGIRVDEKVLYPADLEQADSVFITSTTRELLPVRSVEGLKVRTLDQTRALLQSAFSQYLREYVRNRTNLGTKFARSCVN